MWSCRRLSVRALGFVDCGEFGVGIWRVRDRTCGLTPAGDQHGERIARLAGADLDRDVRQGRRRAAASSSSRVGEAEVLIAEAARAPSAWSCSRRSRTSRRPPGRRMRAASASASLRVARHGAAPATAARRRRRRRAAAAARGRPSSTATLVTRRRVGQRLGALEHLVRAIDADDRARPARRLEREVALAAADVGDVERRQQVAERARPGRPAAARHQLPRVAVGLEVLLAEPQHFLQPGLVLAHRLVVGRGGELRVEQRPERAVAVGCAPRRRAGSRRSRPRALRRPGPASFSRPRWRETPDCATPRMPVSSLTLKRSWARTRSRRRRVASPGAERGWRRAA